MTAINKATPNAVCIIVTTCKLKRSGVSLTKNCEKFVGLFRIEPYAYFLVEAMVNASNRHF